MSEVSNLSTQIPGDVLHRSRLATRKLIWSSGATVLLAAAWACWPLTPGTAPNPPTLEARAVAQANLEPLDLTGFEQPLWAARLAESASALASAPPPPPTPPLKLQLLGITEDPDTHERHAVVFDPEGNRILILASGDSVGSRYVREVQPAAVSFALGEATQTLVLRPDLVSSGTRAGGRP